MFLLYFLLKAFYIAGFISKNKCFLDPQSSATYASSVCWKSFLQLENLTEFMLLNKSILTVSNPKGFGA